MGTALRSSLMFGAGIGLLALLGAAAPRADQPFEIIYPPYPGEAGGQPYSVSVSIDRKSAGSRTFELRSTAPQRDDAPSRRTISETGKQPFVATGNPLFDALFTMTLDDARLNSVSSIRDDAYNEGRPIPCNCFQTGEKWRYVWTRDLAYALDLGLAGLDPQRAVESLLFKTSGFRPEVKAPPELPAGSAQIVQDTGSGGSWPISTDRTAWALGAERTLAHLSGKARLEFAKKAYQALRGTIEADRIAAFDPHDGLYGGEHSFLDWREQSYAPWIVDHLSLMAQSKALSTNVLQYRAIRLAAHLAKELGDEASSLRYNGWADELRPAIDGRFWIPKAGLYATFTSADRHAAPIAKYDLLGNMLAILSGVADADRAQEILTHYPFAPFGPPVLWPQASGQYVYHNRAMWPFVTAYTLKAAAQSGNVDAADRALAALMRGAALNLSNMENLEWLTGKAQFDDGPAINSRRQLWSVGGYYGAIVGTVFGWQPSLDGVRVEPFLTTATRDLFGDGRTARLGGLTYLGRPVEIMLRLPPRAQSGQVYDVQQVRLNGRPVSGTISADQLRSRANRVEVRFGAARASGGKVTTIPIVPALSHDDPRVFMPPTPVLADVKRLDGRVGLTIVKPGGEAPLEYTVYRDGLPIAAKLSAGQWVDRAPPAAALTTCYSAISANAITGLASQPSLPTCLRGSLAQTIAATDERIVTDGTRIGNRGSVPVPTIRLRMGDRLTIPEVAIAARGTYAFSANYDNHVFALNTGITNAVKRLILTDAAGRQQQVVLQMPHVKPEGDLHPIRQSTRAFFKLQPGRYRLELRDFFNMSALSANRTYTGPGGTGGAVNQARIAAINIDAVELDYLEEPSCATDADRAKARPWTRSILLKRSPASKITGAPGSRARSTTPM